MKATGTAGRPLTIAAYTWGENAESRTWDRASKTWRYRYPWGEIATTYTQHGDTLDIAVHLQNRPNSGITLDGASIFPLALHFNRLPTGFGAPNYLQLAYNTGAPSITVADFGAGEVAAVLTGTQGPLYSGFLPTGAGIAYTALLSSTVPDGLADFQPHFDRPLRPGQTDHYTLSLRFAPSGTPSATLAADALHAFSAEHAEALHWTDRRAIGTVYLASSPSGNPQPPGGPSNNPRRYFINDPNAPNLETPHGLAAFQHRILAQAETNVANLKRLGAQGVITWDIEGEPYPQSTSYICAPDDIARIAPEMESVITDPALPHRGAKLDDAYFAIMRSAGFRVGVCLREDQIAADLLRKAKFAHDRWGATLFYVDSTVTGLGFPLPATIFEKVAAALPDSLFIPEESTTLSYAYTAPFQSFLYHNETGTPADVLKTYPHAFSAILINDANPAKLHAAEPKLIDQVRQGDILMTHADYWQDNNPTIVYIYTQAKKSAH